jgi:hypothetical protein
MLRNHFGSHVPSDLLLLEDGQSIQIEILFSSLAVCHFKMLYYCWNRVNLKKEGGFRILLCDVYILVMSFVIWEESVYPYEVWDILMRSVLLSLTFQYERTAQQK